MSAGFCHQHRQLTVVIQCSVVPEQPSDLKWLAPTPPLLVSQVDPHKGLHPSSNPPKVYPYQHSSVALCMYIGLLSLLTGDHECCCSSFLWTASTSCASNSQHRPLPCCCCDRCSSWGAPTGPTSCSPPSTSLSAPTSQESTALLQQWPAGCSSWEPSLTGTATLPQLLTFCPTPTCRTSKLW